MTYLGMAAYVHPGVVEFVAAGSAAVLSDRMIRVEGLAADREYSKVRLQDAGAAFNVYFFDVESGWLGGLMYHGAISA